MALCTPLARAGARTGAALGVELVPDAGDADCVLLCGPVEWEAKRFRALERRGALFGGVSPGLPDAPQAWPDGRSRPSSGTPTSAGRRGSRTTSQRRRTPRRLIAERCLELEPSDPLSAARTLSTSTFFGGFELDETGLQTGHRLSVVRWRDGRQEPSSPIRLGAMTVDSQRGVLDPDRRNDPCLTRRRLPLENRMRWPSRT